ncbi:MAG: hypothetical protein SGPRY_005708 [Prymnesium sp.]
MHLDKLRKRAEDLDARLEEVRSARAGLTVTLRGLSKEEGLVRTRVSKLEAVEGGADSQKKAMEGAVERAREVMGMSGEEGEREKTLAAEVRRVEGQVEGVVRKVEVIDGEIRALQQKAEGVGGTKLRALKGRVEGLTSQVGGVEEALTAARVGVEGGRRSVDRLSEAIEAKREVVSGLEGKVVEAKEALERLHAEAGEVLACVEEMNARHAEGEEGLRVMEEEYGALKAVVGKVRTVEVEMRGQVEDFVKSIKDNKSRVAHWEGKLSALREAVEGGREAGGEEGEEGGEGGLGDLSEEELVGVDAAATQGEITTLEGRLKDMNGNLSAISEYKARVKEFHARVAEFDEVTRLRDETRGRYESLRRRRLEEFMEGFKIIGLRLREMYQMITLGGDAELELLDSLDPFSEGIVFSVRPPKKSWKNIANLSGGEKTLSSLALVFALHHYKPTPLYVMDEIDAALDFRNVSIVGNYIKERTRNAQFIIISLRNNMFELADRLVGIYKTQNATKAVAIDPQAFTIAAC